jgi:hypothetical protein
MRPWIRRNHGKIHARRVRSPQEGAELDLGSIIIQMISTRLRAPSCMSGTAFRSECSCKCGLVRRSRLVPEADRAQGPGLPCGPPARSIQRVWRWPGWQKCRSPGLRWRPSTAWGHARLGTRSSLPGAYATGCGLSSACEEMTIKGGNSRSTRPGWRVITETGTWRPNMAVMAAKYGRYVPASPILDRMCGSRGWKRDHSQSVGTRQERSRRERACLQAGDGRPSNHAISVLIPSRPRPHVGGPRERDRHTRTPGLRPTRFGPSRVRRANETSSARPAFRGTRRGRFCERPEVIHTLEIGVTAVRARSNNNPVDLGCVDR